MPQVRAGKVVALAVASSHRSDLAPGVPSLADLGVKDLDIEVWVGMAVASTMPEADSRSCCTAAAGAVICATDRRWPVSEHRSPIVRAS